MAIDLTFLQKFFFPIFSIGIQVSLIIIILFLLSLFFKKSPANFRYILWSIVLIRLCLPFNLSPISLYHNPIKDISRKIITSDNINPDIKNQKTTRLMTNEVTIPDKFIPENHYKENDKLINPQTTLLTSVNIIARLKSNIPLFYFIIVLVLGIIVSLRYLTLRKFITRCALAEDSDLKNLMNKYIAIMGIKQKIALHCCPEGLSIESPLTAGIIRPKIILPVSLVEQWKPSEIEPILLHELSHIKRHDLLINLIQIIVQIIYFFNPLIWYANWKIRHEREMACDDLALHYGKMNRKDYSSCILKIIEEYQTHSSAYAVMGMIDSKNLLARRIIRIMSKNYQNYQTVGKLAKVFLVIMMVLFFSISGENLIKPASDNKAETIERMINQLNFTDSIKLSGEYINNSKDNKSLAKGHLLLARALCVKAVEYRDVEARYDGYQNLKKAFELDPSLKNEPDIARDRANLMIFNQTSDKCDEALEEAQKEITKEPKNPQTYFYKGMLHFILLGNPDYCFTDSMKEKQRKSAAELMKKALDIQPERYEYWAYYITVINDIDNHNEAKKMVEKMMKEADLSPDKIPPYTTDPDILYSLFIIEKEANNYIREQAKKKPEYIELQKSAALSYSDKEPLKSIKMLEELIQKIDKQEIKVPTGRTFHVVSSLYKLAHLYYNNGEKQKALNTYNKLIVLSPNYAETRYNLAIVYLSMAEDEKDNDKKIDLLRKAKSEIEIQLQVRWHNRYDHFRSTRDNIDKELSALKKK